MKKTVNKLFQGPVRALRRVRQGDILELPAGRGQSCISLSDQALLSEEVSSKLNLGAMQEPAVIAYSCWPLMLFNDSYKTEPECKMG